MLQDLLNLHEWSASGWINANKTPARGESKQASSLNETTTVESTLGKG